MRLLITGGAGFIGCNFADHRLSLGDEVVIYDNLSRPKTDLNLDWLQANHQSGLSYIEADVRDNTSLVEAVKGVDTVFHLAGQVAVTTSVVNPREDFEVNALGTFNVLEAVRQEAPNALVVFSSTNKVYGGMEDVPIIESPTRYSYQDLPEGVSEKQPLDFLSPYGCSKGSADQYVRDYARIYGVKTVVLRQSCVYGIRQFGVEDQGWIAHFCISIALDHPIIIYGDGKQVRDVLWIDDLLQAYDLVLSRADAVSGQVYNIGGGFTNTISIWKEFGTLLTELSGRNPQVLYKSWRPGDQEIYVSDIRKAQRELSWSPKVRLQDGVQRLWSWVLENINLFR